MVELPQIRVDNPSKWRLGALIGIHLLILIHIVHWLTTGHTIAGLEPSEAMKFSKYGVINMGLLLLVGAALITAVFGRFFCGWGCHIIAMQDLCRWLMLKAGITPKPLRSRILRWIPIGAFVYMFVWPIVYRLGVGQVFPATTMALATTNLWASMPGLVIGGLTILICGFATVYVLGAKGFCTYACPYGALFGVADRLAPLRIRVTEDCNQCARCTAACTSNVRVHEQVRDFAMVRDSGCMKCLDCVATCPNDALYLGLGRPALGAAPRVEGPPAPRPWNVSWLDEVVLATAFVVAFATFRGLYGRVPFLMALGLSGILAFLTLTTIRLVRSPNLRFGGSRLKRDWAVTVAGWAFAFGMAGVTALWAHSALVRFHEIRGGRVFSETAGLRAAALGLSFSGLGDQDLIDRVETARRDFVWGENWGLISNPSSYFPAGWVAFLQGRMDTALTLTEQALVVQPKAAEVHLLYGRVLVGIGRPKEAVMAMARSVELDPSVPQAFISLGSLLGALGDVPRAREVFRRGVLRHPANADLHFNFGVACAIEGDFGDAAGAFQRTLAIDPEHRKARENLDGLAAFRSPVE